MNESQQFALACVAVVVAVLVLTAVGAWIERRMGR